MKEPFAWSYQPWFQHVLAIFAVVMYTIAIVLTTALVMTTFAPGEVAEKVSFKSHCQDIEK